MDYNHFLDALRLLYTSSYLQSSTSPRMAIHKENTQGKETFLDHVNVNIDEKHAWYGAEVSLITFPDCQWATSISFILFFLFRVCLSVAY